MLFLVLLITYSLVFHKTQRFQVVDEEDLFQSAENITKQKQLTHIKGVIVLTSLKAFTNHQRIICIKSHMPNFLLS